MDGNGPGRWTVNARKHTVRVTQKKVSTKLLIQGADLQQATNSFSNTNVIVTTVRML